MADLGVLAVADDGHGQDVRHRLEEVHVVCAEGPLDSIEGDEDAKWLARADERHAHTAHHPETTDRVGRGEPLLVGHVPHDHRLPGGQHEVAQRPGRQLTGHRHADYALRPANADAQDQPRPVGVDLGQPDHRDAQGSGHRAGGVVHQLLGLEARQRPLAELGHSRLLDGAGAQVGLRPAALRHLAGRRGEELGVVDGHGGTVGELLDVSGVSRAVDPPGAQANENPDLPAPSPQRRGDQAGDAHLPHVGVGAGSEHGIELPHLGLAEPHPARRVQHRWVDHLQVLRLLVCPHDMGQGRGPPLGLLGVGVVHRDVAGIRPRVVQQVEDACVVQGLRRPAHHDPGHLRPVRDDLGQLARQLGHGGHARDLAPESLVARDVRLSRNQRLRSAHPDLDPFLLEGPNGPDVQRPRAPRWFGRYINGRAP